MRHLKEITNKRQTKIVLFWRPANEFLEDLGSFFLFYIQMPSSSPCRHANKMAATFGVFIFACIFFCNFSFLFIQRCLLSTWLNLFFSFFLVTKKNKKLFYFPSNFKCFVNFQVRWFQLVNNAHLQIQCHHLLIHHHHQHRQHRQRHRQFRLGHQLYVAIVALYWFQKFNVKTKLVRRLFFSATAKPHRHPVSLLNWISLSILITWLSIAIAITLPS